MHYRREGVPDWVAQHRETGCMAADLHFCFLLFSLTGFSADLPCFPVKYLLTQDRYAFALASMISVLAAFELIVNGPNATRMLASPIASFPMVTA
jgi:hypothetical protein